MSQIRFLYTLECDHVALAPSGNLTLWCPWCELDKRITDVHIHEWKTKCWTCTFTRWTGLSAIVANQFAHRHNANHPTHRITVEYSKNPQAVKEQEKRREMEL